jgi:putative colanic acid biosynthesis UDP-glucose lipid carrier transferase
MAYSPHSAQQKHLADALDGVEAFAAASETRPTPPPPSVRHLNERSMVVLRPLMLMLDLGILTVTGGLLFQDIAATHGQALNGIWLAATLFTALFYVCGLGRRQTLQTRRAALVRPAVALGLTFAGVALACTLTGLPVPVTDLIPWAAASTALITGARLLTCHFLKTHPLAARWQESIAFLGHARDIAQIFASLPTAARLPVRISGYYSISQAPEVALSGLTHLGSVETQDYLLLNRPLDRLILVAREINAEHLGTLLTKIEALSCPVDLCLLPLVDVAPDASQRRPLTSLDVLVQRCRLIPLQSAPMSVTDRATKRLFDIVASSLALLALTPVLAGAALAVRLSSPGPILFRQPRWGRNGQTFHILKFRSMYAHSCDSGRGSVQQATRTDPRITPVGRLLRSTSIDELPQLLNVLRGDMSLIGPRPHAVAHNELYARKVQGYIARHRAKPGISGWAQVHGYRGETPHIHLMQKRIDYDADYIRNWSLILDLRIILKTLMLVVSRKNAW